MAIVQIAVTIFIFTLMFLIFAYAKTDYKIGVWVIVMFIFSMILGLATTSSDNSQQRTHPSFLIAEYSKYNNNTPINEND